MSRDTNSHDNTESARHTDTRDTDTTEVRSVQQSKPIRVDPTPAIATVDGRATPHGNTNPKGSRNFRPIGT